MVSYFIGGYIAGALTMLLAVFVGFYIKGGNSAGE